MPVSNQRWCKPHNTCYHTTMIGFIMGAQTSDKLFCCVLNDTQKKLFLNLKKIPKKPSIVSLVLE